MTIELTHNNFLSTQFLWFVFLSSEILLYYMCFGVLISAIDSCDYILMLEIGRASGSMAVFFAKLFPALYTELTNFVVITVILYVICRGQSCVEQHVFVFYYLLR